MYIVKGIEELRKSKAITIWLRLDYNFISQVEELILLSGRRSITPHKNAFSEETRMPLCPFFFIHTNRFCSTFDWPETSNSRCSFARVVALGR